MTTELLKVVFQSNTKQLCFESKAKLEERCRGLGIKRERREHTGEMNCKEAKGKTKRRV